MSYQGHLSLFVLFEALPIPMFRRETAFKSRNHKLSPGLHSPPIHKASSAYLKSSVLVRQAKSAAVPYAAFDPLLSLLIAIIFFL